MSGTETDSEASLLVREGLLRHRAGGIDEAERLYRQALALVPDQADALHYLGLVLHQRGQFREAADTLALAAGPLDGDADFHANFGLALKNAGRWTRAKTEYARARSLRPDHAGATFNLALLLGEEGDPAGSVALFAQLAERSPANAEARCFLGRALKEQGRWAEARQAMHEAVRIDPGYDFAWARLAELELDAGKLDAALAAAKKVAEFAPGSFDAAVAVAEVHDRRGEAAARDAWLARARVIEGDPVRIYFTLGIEFANRSLLDQARRALRRGLMFAPDHAMMRWSLARFLPESYADDDAIDRARQGYVAGLDAIEESLRLDNPEAARDAFDALQVMTNFLLAYQGKNDRDLQTRFGRIARKVVAARFSEFAGNPTPLPPDPARKLRVGFLSAFFRQHVVSRLYGGWMEKLDRRRFEVFGYHTGKDRDDSTERFAGHCDTFRHLPLSVASDRDRSEARDVWFADLCRTLAADRLDALIFPEIGMDMTTFALAALRFAPVQASGIGHPVTTGLSTVDYFLSGELIEPPEGAAHYSEKLVRLPNISIRPSESVFVKDHAPKTRESFGFGADEVVYLCSQSIYKYLPRYDRIFPAIARAVPAAKLVFVRSILPEQDAVLRVRLARAFAEAGIERDRRCVFLDAMPTQDFVTLHRVGDVFLDPPGWSGGGTTLDALAAGLPIVTLPGEFMRGRVSYGMLRMIGVEETVARDVNDYIAIAIRLGREPDIRAEVRAKIEANREKLYNDEACVRGLENFIVRAVAAANPAARK